MKSPKDIVLIMMNEDSFSKWLGIKVVEIEKGSCQLTCEVTKDMLNGFHIAHGGITD